MRRAYAGDLSALNRLYLIQDPWNLNSKEGECFRFQETSRIISEKIGSHFDCIFEIGCGEGLQTQYLAPLAKRIIGLDPSSRAISRARAKGITNASFLIGNIYGYDGQSQKKCDLVTACEILYYLPDLNQAFKKLNSLGKICLVTYYQGAFQRLDGFFEGKQVSHQIIDSGRCKWKVVYWHSSD